MATCVANSLLVEQTRWQTLALGPSAVTNFRRISEAQLLQWITEFFGAHRELFYQADAVVIEQQRGARLRVLAGALYALTCQARKEDPKKSLPELQAPFCKLAFDGVTLSLNDESKKAQIRERGTTPASGLHTTGYQARKRIAVQLVSLLKAHLPQTQVQTFEDSVKKDDLADAMLHAMWRACRLVVAAPPSSSRPS
jgi:hypothetical protein